MNEVWAEISTGAEAKHQQTTAFEAKRDIDITTNLSLLYCADGTIGFWTGIAFCAKGISSSE